MERWIAECLHCKWQAEFDTQPEAIDAVEEHLHTTGEWRLPAEQRCADYRGHVQFRSTFSPKPVPKTEPEKTVQTAVSHPGDGKANYYETPAPEAQGE